MSEKDDFSFPEQGEGHEPGGDAPGFDQEPEEWQDEKKLRKALKKAERKKTGSSSRILLLLLLLVVLAAAAYYFMGMPQPEPSPAPPKVVKKQPIAVPPPPKKEEPAKAQPAAEQAPVAAEKPTGEPPAKDETAAGAAPADQPPAAASADEAAPSVSVAGESTAAATTAPAAAEAPARAYTIQAGAYLLKANLVAAMNKLSRMGYEPIVEEGSKEVAMTRLRLGAFPAEEAESRIEELSRIVPGVFTLPGDNGVVVYAGSYYNLDKARALADRLYAQGIRLEEERVEIAVPLYQLSFGGFAGLEEAAQAAERAREAGLDAYVSKEG